MAGETGSFSLAPSMIPPARRLFPSDATGSIRDSGSRHRGSNPRRGAMPIPLRNAQSLFSFRSEGHTEFRGQSLASMDTVWRAVFRQRCPPLSRCAGTARSGKGAASAFNRAERAPSAITPTGLVTAAKPCMAGFDSRNRLSSDTSKAGRIHAAARVGLRRKEATCWSRRSSSSAFSSHYCSHGRCAASPPSATTKWTADSTTDTPA